MRNFACHSQTCDAPSGFVQHPINNLIDHSGAASAELQHAALLSHDDLAASRFVFVVKGELQSQPSGRSEAADKLAVDDFAYFPSGDGHRC